jgi:hypothetical protein
MRRSTSSSQSFIESRNRDNSLDSFSHLRSSFDSVKKPRLPNGLTDSTLSVKKIPMQKLCPGCELKMCFRRSHKSHAAPVEHGQD